MVEGLFYPYSENKGADQLRGYREADLRLCFRICKKPVFTRRGSNYTCLIIQKVNHYMIVHGFECVFCIGAGIQYSFRINKVNIEQV